MIMTTKKDIAKAIQEERAEAMAVSSKHFGGAILLGSVDNCYVKRPHPELFFKLSASEREDKERILRSCVRGRYGPDTRTMLAGILDHEGNFKVSGYRVLIDRIELDVNDILNGSYYLVKIRNNRKFNLLIEYPRIGNFKEKEAIISTWDEEPAFSAACHSEIVSDVRCVVYNNDDEMIKASLLIRFPDWEYPMLYTINPPA